MSNSFFLFGPRGTGKSTYLNSVLPKERTLKIDLLESEEESVFLINPDYLLHRLEEVKKNCEWVFIDEVQKVPKLLDVVHKEIEKKCFKFALSGSSARKLKRGQANLLAGRAFEYHLHPFTYRELDSQFNLSDALRWGLLPALQQYSSDAEKSKFLKTYVNTYLREEILMEQLVRQIRPFRLFLEVASQMNGELINTNAIAKQIGVDHSTVANYFEILEDTLIGFRLFPFEGSFRKRMTKSAKFYLFDIGVVRVLNKQISLPLHEKTFEFGKAFEHFFILQALQLNEYLERDFSFYFLRTKDDAEIDLIIQRPACPLALIEIKSSNRITESHVATINKLSSQLGSNEAFCASLDKKPQKIGNVRCLYWADVLQEVGL